MHVVWLFEYPTLNGGERSLLATLPTLRSEGIEPISLGPAVGPLATELARKGVAYVPFDTFDPGGQKLPRDVLRQLLADHLSRLRPALLDANSLSMGRLSGPVARANVPSIAHLRDIVGLSQAAVADLNCHTRLLAVSHATRDFHLRQGVDAARTLVCYNGVDLTRFRPQPPTGRLHLQLGLPRDAVLVAAIGQIIHRKGQDVVICAARQLERRLARLHWLIVGERHSQKPEAAEYEAALHAEIRSAGLTDRIHFLGTTDGVEKLLPELTLLVHAARQEPLGRVLLEAASAGVPCVASDVGGTREIFPDSTFARLIPPNDPDALTEAVAALVENPAERERLAHSARRRMAAMFDADSAGKALAEHYREVSRDGSSLHRASER
ncbi:MAG TPA: glycosyltransferase [Pirellulales bacterium]|nr:glycosyltransferase [Pirellulales bacterium]